MKILSIILIAVSLSMDTFSLALSIGTSLTKRKDILFLSFPIVLGSAIGFLIFLFYPVLLVKRIKNEEMILENGLEGYKEYKERVKYRLIPFIW